jgi:hypothetical protein
MIEGDVEALSRAHQLFAGSSELPAFGSPYRGQPRRGVDGLNDVLAQGDYQLRASDSRDVLLAAASSPVLIRIGPGPMR